MAVKTAVSFAALKRAALTWTMPGRVLDCLLDGVEAIGATLADVGDDGERAVEAGAEALFEEVVGAAAVGRGWVVAVVAEAEVHGKHRDGHEQKPDRGGDEVEQRPSLNSAAEAIPAAFHVDAFGGVKEGHTQAVDALPGERKKCGHQRQGDEHGGADDNRASSAHRRHEGQAHGEQPEEGYRDDDAGEDDGTARGQDGGHDGLFHALAGVQPFAEARHDEEAVVDADADPDHRGELRREVGERCEVRGEAEDREGAPEAKERRADGEAHRHDRTECHEEDEHGSEQADGFGAEARVLGVGHGAAADFDGQAVAGGSVGGIDERYDLSGRKLFAGLVPADSGAGDGAGGSDIAGLVVGRIDADDAGECLYLRYERVNALVDGGIGDAGVGAEDEVRGVAGLRGEPGREEVLCGLGFGAWQFEARRVAAAENVERNDEGDERHGPDKDHAATAAMRQPRPAFQQTHHVSPARLADGRTARLLPRNCARPTRRSWTEDGIYRNRDSVSCQSGR